MTPRAVALTVLPVDDVPRTVGVTTALLARQPSGKVLAIGTENGKFVVYTTADALWRLRRVAVAVAVAGPYLAVARGATLAIVSILMDFNGVPKRTWKRWLQSQR